MADLYKKIQRDKRRREHEATLPRCVSECGKHKCELHEGHKWKHRNGGVSWTDGGAKRVNAERAAEPEEAELKMWEELNKVKMQVS